MRKTANARGGGFTLVEILVVVGILAVLVAILIPVLSKARERAKSAATSGTMNTLVVGLEAYRSDMGRYPTFSTPPGYANPGINSGVANYEFNILASGLTGWKQGTSNSWGTFDGADGAGFRTEKQGRVYGPYVTPSGKNFKIFRSASDFPNPGAAASASPAAQTEVNAYNAAFVDAWGLPIFYSLGMSSLARDQSINANPLYEVHAAGWGRGIFLKGNPDATTTVTYTVNGQAVNSRLVPYTPAGKWDPATTPWGSCLSMTAKDSEYASNLNPMPGVKFRALIGMSQPSSPSVKVDDRLAGRSSYLLVSAGQDNQYYTGDEILGESNR